MMYDCTVLNDCTVVALGQIYYRQSDFHTVTVCAAVRYVAALNSTKLPFLP